MGSFSMHRIKSQARREAWYGDSWNPFRKVWSHSGGSSSNSIGDVEANSATFSNSMHERRLSGERDVGPVGGLERTTSDPPRFANHRQPQQEHDHIDSGMAGGSGSEEKSNAGANKESHENTMNSQSTGRPPSEEQVARKRFFEKFKRGSSNNGNGNSKTSTGLSTSKSRKSTKKFTFGSQIRSTLFNSWINILLLAAPVGVALYAIKATPVAIFVVNFMAIIPLAALLSFATEEIALRVGETLGGLLNASFGNAVELIVSILALVKGEVVIVKTSLIGSILSNLLLVMGMCFFFGGVRRTEQYFNETVANTAASLLALAIASIIIPTAFDKFTDTTDLPIAEISRGTAIILLAVYGCYLYFQLHTHAEVFNAESKKVAIKPRKKKHHKGDIAKGLAQVGGVGAGPGRYQETDESRHSHDQIMNTNAEEDQDNDEEEPQLHIWVAIFTLAASTVVIAFCAEFMVDSIEALTQGPDAKISAEFVGLILLPIVGNAAEHATAVTVAIKDKMDLAIGVAVGSSMQIALLVIPFSVVLGWILNNDKMNLSFDGFQVAVLFVSVLLVNYLIGDGKSHWLEGVLLQCLYLIIAVTAWFYPPVDLSG